MTKIVADKPLNAEYYLSAISLESSVLANMSQSLKNLFPDLIDSVRNSFNQIIDLPAFNLTLSLDQKFLLKEISGFPYIDIAEFTINTPEGFKGTYIDYTKVLYKALERIQGIDVKVLQPYATYLSTFLSNKDSKISTKDNTKIYKDIKVTREHMIHDLGKFFTNSSSKSKTTIGSVVKRNADFKVIYDEMVIIKKKLDVIDLKNVSNNVKNCLDLLDIIILRIKNDEIENVSPEVTQNLSVGAYEIAKEIEFFSVIYFKVLAMNTAVDELTTKVVKYIKNIPDTE